MSQQVTTAFVQEYTRGVDMLVQQADSRLRSAVRVEGGIVGKQAFFDQIGAVEAVLRTTRHSDTPQIDTPHARRMAPMNDYEWADLLDEPDKVRVLNDPTNAYSQNAARAMLRKIDDELIAAALGTSFTGETGTTGVALPATQIILSGGAPLTAAFVKDAGKRLKEAENPMDEPWYLVISAQQEEDLLLDNDVVSGGQIITSSDYVQGQPLMTGSLKQLYGFNIILSERLPTVAGPDRQCFAFRQSALLLAIARDSVGDIGPRRDKSMSMQVFYRMTIGSTRMEELGVVEIRSRES